MKDTLESGPESGGNYRHLGMIRRLRDYLDRPSDEPERTWSERVLRALVSEAAKGDVRAQHEIFQRVGADPDSGEDAMPLLIDDETARRVLEAVREPVKPRSDS